MKTHSIFRLAFFAIISILMSTQAFAQADHSGNGGGEDGAFKVIRDEVKTWMQKSINSGSLNEKFEIANASEVFDKFIAATELVGDKVVFNRELISFNGNVRICKNDPTEAVITCNIDAWNGARGDLRYMIVLHEYLGIAEIETNINEYSRYAISSKILGYVYDRHSFELGMDKNNAMSTEAFLTYLNESHFKDLRYICPGTDTSVFADAMSASKARFIKFNEDAKAPSEYVKLSVVSFNEIIREYTFVEYRYIKERCRIHSYEIYDIVTVSLKWSLYQLNPKLRSLGKDKFAELAKQRSVQELLEFYE